MDGCDTKNLGKSQFTRRGCTWTVGSSAYKVGCARSGLVLPQICSDWIGKAGLGLDVRESIKVRTLTAGYVPNVLYVRTRLYALVCTQSPACNWAQDRDNAGES